MKKGNKNFPEPCPPEGGRRRTFEFERAFFKSRFQGARGVGPREARRQRRAAEGPQPALYSRPSAPRSFGRGPGVEATPPLQCELRPLIGAPRTNGRVGAAPAVSPRRSRSRGEAACLPPRGAPQPAQRPRELRQPLASAALPNCASRCPRPTVLNLAAR